MATSSLRCQQRWLVLDESTLGNIYLLYPASKQLQVVSSYKNQILPTDISITEGNWTFVIKMSPASTRRPWLCKICACEHYIKFYGGRWESAPAAKAAEWCSHLCKAFKAMGRYVKWSKLRNYRSVACFPLKYVSGLMEATPHQC